MTAGFAPPKGYDQMEAEAMNVGVNNINKEDIYMSIGVNNKMPRNAPDSDNDERERKRGALLSY